MVLLKSHVRILKELVRRGDRGMTASKLIAKREYRTKVIKYLESEGLVRVTYSGGGMRVYATERARKLLERLEKEKPELLVNS
ncbi:MAG: hypothetical protein DRN78_06135 [Thermoproteota archaeon]|nr:hypothetical protein [Candidatus Korarchaeota archaeon]RLG39910.1 MAG: hypothetical protein DRN78_06135 [Candidatus Korarchaeota archaeon]